MSQEKSSNISFNTLRDYNSEHSSLNSVNRKSICQNYINGFNNEKEKNPKKNYVALNLLSVYLE